MYSHVACDVMKERTLYLLKPSSLIWHLCHIFSCSITHSQQKISAEIVNILLPIILAYVLGAQKNRLIETVLLSTLNICFG